MNKKNIVIGLVILIVVGFLIYLLSNQKQTYFKKITLSHNNVITNKTSKSYLDTLVSEGLDVLDLKGEFVTIRTMDPSFKDALGTNTVLRAFIIGERNQYIIYIDDLSRNESLTILSHELIHLKQYSSGKLIRMEDHFMMFNDEVYNVDEIPYKERPWEIEAFKQESDLKLKLENILY